MSASKAAHRLRLKYDKSKVTKLKRIIRGFLIGWMHDAIYSKRIL
jgi:hypothetical protein